MIGRGERAPLGRTARATAVIGLVAALVAAFALWLGVRSPVTMGFGAVAVLVYAAAVWQWALESTERQAVLSVIQRKALRRQPAGPSELGSDVARDRASTL
jgi:hypothetical protein